MASARQKVFGNAPKIGTGIGEPSATPVARTQEVFGGAPGLSTTGAINRGAKQVGGGPGGNADGYGGAPVLTKYPTPKRASGSGDGTGAGATSGTSVP